ncbi:MAG: hypothetical protein AB7F79_07180 [Steroidobacteraceae bacterium]
MNTSISDSVDGQVLDLREPFRTLWKSKWLILAVTAAAAVNSF